jgi:O2-independent ubiquinone biosynthesis accessory factor UbiT
MHRASIMRLPEILTLGLSPVPTGIVNEAARIVFSHVLSRHPNLFDRLGEHATKRFGFVPTDLPFAHEILPSGPSIRTVRRGAMLNADATVKGPIVLLLALLEGRIDGDAVFFSRALEVSGDTEAVLALRNALDDSEIDLPTDLATLAGPFGAPVRRGLEAIRERLLAGRTDGWS